jgi:small-conductance mechanosensitive channel
MGLFEDARRTARLRAFASPVPVRVPVLASLAAVMLASSFCAVIGWSIGTSLVVVAAVLLGCAALAHRTVSSVLAGVALLVVRPYAAGERVRMPVPDDWGVLEAVVVHVGIANTTLAADTGVLVVPNRRLLRNPPTPSPPAPNPLAA